MVVDLIAADPTRGDLIPGGGVRKLRIGLDGRGKSGGARVVYFFHSHRLPVYLLAIFAKNERSDLSRAELNLLAKAVKAIGKSMKT